MKGFTVINLALVALVTLHAASSAPTISDTLLASLKETKRSANIILSMSQGLPAENLLKDFQFKKFSSRSAKLNAVHNVLKSQADRVQKNVLTFLQSKRLPAQSVRQLWISNQIIIMGADFSLVQELAARSDIAKIEEERLIPIEEIYPSIKSKSVATKVKADKPQWGVAMVEASSVWSNGTTGQGVIVGSVDTGVRGTHEALRNNYKNDSHSWFAPQKYSENPIDPSGHGTHTLGTVLGQTNGVGVAPGAQWIACGWCESSTCSDFSLRECGQWILCPTKYDNTEPDCSKAPHIVTNSWGWNDRPWYDDILNAWKTGDIIAIFSMGNDGNSCGSNHYPGTSDLVISVSSTTNEDKLSDFSSIGPSDEMKQKPQVGAPGSNVVSSGTFGDDEYWTMSGTSMAAPHVSGVATLLKSVNVDLTFDEIKQLLQDGAVPTNPVGETCSGASDDKYPNYHVGYGRINAGNSYLKLVENM